MKILTSTPEKLEQALDHFEKLAMAVLPQIGRTIIYDNGFWLVGQNAAGENNDGRTSLRYDIVHYDEGQKIHYIKNLMYTPGYRDEYLAMIQQIINDLELVEDDNFTPTPEEEPEPTKDIKVSVGEITYKKLTNINKEP